MEERESLREVESLRFRFQMNNRLRLECLAAVSKVLREFETPLTDELLGSIVFALPQELVSNNGHGHARVQAVAGNPPERPGNPPERPGNPPETPPGNPPEKPPGNPPEKPPGNPPEKPPGNPPEKPPGNPPEKPPGNPPETPQKAY